MNEVTLPPSPNWYLSNILACANDGTVAWGARNSIVIARSSNDNTKLDYKIIDKAHPERVNSVAFSPEKDANGHLSLVSSADDNVVKVWNADNLSLQHKNTQLNNNQKVIGVDWSKHNPNLICFISDDGILVTWDIKHNVNHQINLSKLIGSKVAATCISCCPHDSNFVSIGTKTGLICIVDLRTIGKTNKYFKLRGHNKEIVSLSWCPVPINVFQETETKEFLLASGAKDREIYLWKAGTDYRYEAKLTITSAPLESSHHKTKISSSAGNFTAVCWLEPMTLLSSSPWGELLMWDLTGYNPKKKFTSKLVHDIHTKGLFSIAGLSEKSLEQAEESVISENDNWRQKNNIKAIWTLSQDRQMVCSSLVQGETKIEYKIPTIGGFVYCMSACPVDTTQIAFGVGDNMIRLWNLSEPHGKSIDMQMLWEKIMSKVRALCWHSEKENLLAFATDEGRIGVFDTNVKKPPTLYRLHYRNTVYRIGWGPAPNLNEHALYSCADYELAYYTPGKTEDKPTTVMKKDCTEFGWKPDYSLLAVGFVDGSISFLKPDLSETGERIRILNKPIQCFAWHPESTATDTNLSPMQNYLAVATTESDITIFDISCKKIDENDESSELSHRIVATLKGHSDKVVCLAWSPHISGYLVSGAYDYSAQVWKVETQEIMASFLGHSGPVQCCMWSPSNPEIILTGSSDFTLQMWNISKQGISLPSHPAKTSTKGKRTKKKKTKETQSDNSTEVNSIAKEKTDIQSVEKELKLLAVNEHETKKKKKKATYFPKYAEIMKDNDAWLSSIRNLLDVVESDSSNGESCAANGNGLDHRPDNKRPKLDKIPVFLGSKIDFEDALDQEKNWLESIGNNNIATKLDMYRGNLKENLIEASKKKRLNDFSVSLAPSISIEFWKEMCETYAFQLAAEEHYHKAVSYLLCLNKVQEAVNVFVNAQMYKEAYLLAVSKLPSNNDTKAKIEKILEDWASIAVQNGHFQNASECYIKLKNYSKAAKVLGRRKDLKSLLLAIDVAERSKDTGLMMSMADNAVFAALVASDIQTAKSIVKNYPAVQYREVEIEIFDELNKLFNDFGDEVILEWLKGSYSNHLLEDIQSRFPKNATQYSVLIKKNDFPDISNEKKLQVIVSHQLALAILADQEELTLKHVVTAFDIILQYEKTNSTFVEDKLPFLIKYFSIFDSRKNVTENYQNELGESLRAYLSHAIIDWYLKDTLTEEQKSECIDCIVEIIQKCINNLLDKESVKFWTVENEIKKVEMKLAELGGKVPSNDAESNETEVLKERLDQLRKGKTLYIQQKVSTPNPLVSYSMVLEVVNKIPVENIRDTMYKLVTEIWQNSTS